MSRFLVSLIISFFITATSWSMDVPSLSGPVVDEAQVLTSQANSAITSALLELNQTDEVQFQVLIVKSLINETIEGYSIKVVDEWKLGKKGKDRAALLLIALDDKKMRIEVGRGLEGNLTDLTTNRILDEMKPYFRKGDYDNGVALGLSLMARAEGLKLNFKGALRPRHKRSGSAPLVLFVIFGLIGFLQFFFPNTRGRGRGFGGGGFGGGGFGGGGFGGGGGSSWSGGGGGFSGGGSSSNW